jgi:hypothetical protein
MKTRHLSLRHARAMVRRHGPEAPVWRRRIAILGGAILVGLIALLFAHLSDWASQVFLKFVHRWWWAPLRRRWALPDWSG